MKIDEKEIENIMHWIEKQYQLGKISPSDYFSARMKLIEMSQKNFKNKESKSWILGSLFTSLSVGFLTVNFFGLMSLLLNSFNVLGALIWTLGFGLPGILLLKYGLENMGVIK